MNIVRLAILSLAITLGSISIFAQDIAGSNSNLTNTEDVISQPTGGINGQINLPNSLIILSRDYDNGSAIIQQNNSLSLHSNLNSDINFSNIQQWEDGNIYGIGSYSTMLGIGNISTLAFVASQDIGQWALLGMISGSKYHLDNSIYNDFSLSASASFNLNNHFALKFFGTYAANNVFHSMATMPYLSYSNFGGSITYRANDTFSIETGVRRYYDPFSHRWETVPIVAPTVKMWNANISVDMGGFIHRLLQSVIVTAPKKPTISPARNMH